jgi:ADP-heptose:LPS heptosyltransferase
MSQSCLVLKNDGIGDLISSSGIISSLASQLGGAVDLVTCEENRELASMIAGVRHIYYVTRDGLKFLPLADRVGLFVPVVRGSVGDWAKDYGTLARLPLQKYDVALSLRRFIRASSLALMRRARARRRFAAFDFCTNLSRSTSDRAAKDWTRIAIADDVLSEQAYFARFVHEALGVVVDTTPRLQLPATNVAMKPRRVGVCLSGTSMRWNLERWLHVIGALLASHWEVVLFGGADCANDARLILQTHPGCRSLIGQLGFRASVAPLRELYAFIGNDTGFSHFASLIVPRCLLITGGGTHGRFFPWQGATNQYVVYFGLDCFDCDWRCKYPRRLCLDELQADAVLQSFEDMTSDRWRGPTWRNLNPVTESYQIAWRHKADGPRRRLDPAPR